MKDLKLNPKNSAEEIVQVILNQSTAETPLDPESTGLVELFLGPKEDRPQGIEKYEKIFAAVAEQTKDPIVALRAQVEVLNAQRRNQDRDLGKILKQLEAMAQEVAEGEVSPAIAGLLAAVYYNMGIANRAPREYQTAAQAQELRLAWLIAAGRPEEALAALFVAGVERATHAIAEDCCNVGQALEHLVRLRQFIATACNVQGWNFPKWIKDNGPIHIWSFYFWTGEDYMEREEDEQAGLAMAEKMPHWAACIRGGRLLRERRFLEAVEEANKAIEIISAGFPSSSQANALLTLMLVKARALFAAGDREESKEVYKKIAGWQRGDGGAIIAAAKKELLRF